MREPDGRLDFQRQLSKRLETVASALALRLAAGRRLVDAARDPGVSVNTARAHLRAIFAKTGVDRQSRLVGALLKSAARVAR